MLLADIIALLQQNNAKTSDFFTVNELKTLVEQASVDVVGATPNAATLYQPSLIKTHAPNRATRWT